MCAALGVEKTPPFFLCLTFFALNHKIKFLKFLIIPCNEPLNLSYRLFCCHTERSEVSTKSKCGFFAFSLTLKMTMFEIFRFLSKAQNDKGAPSLRAVFAKTAWQSKKAFEGSKPPPLRRGLEVGFKTHHTAFERACVPLKVLKKHFWF